MQKALTLKTKPINTEVELFSMSANARRPVASLDWRDKQVKKPKLLNGETIIAEAQTVLKRNNMAKRGSGIMGGLYVTNFKLAFMPPKLESNASISQRVLLSSCHRLDDLLADDETGSHCEFIALTSIWYITAISTGKQISKRLKVGKVPSKKYDIIELSCKDLRVIRFDFSLCREKERASILNAIHVYMSPTSIQKLFAFDHARGCQNTSNASSQGRAFHTFRHEKDLELELARLRAQENWKISCVNEKFTVSKTLPELNLVPSSLQDQDLELISNFYEGGRFPTMVWHSRESGASLLCSSRPSDKDEDNSGHPRKVIEAVKKACFSADAEDPISFELSSVTGSSKLPTLQKLQASYLDLCDTCFCHSNKDFWATDSSWLGKVDGSRWLEHVQKTLTIASEIANTLLVNKRSVIVHDLTGRDFVLVIISLVQLFVDPYYRTLIGLQTLIQKDWVVKGHPFCQRLGVFQETDKGPKNWVFYKDEHILDTDQSPVFILFLDCVHQLLTQFPSQFGFTEQFLLLLIDSVHMCLFETFLFNSEHERKRFVYDSLESLWDFIATQVPPFKFKALFLNRLYNIDKRINIDGNSRISSDASPDLRSTCKNDLVTPSSHGSLASSYKKTQKSKKKKSNWLSVNVHYQSASDPNVSVINPDSSSIHVHLWQKYFLRWAPTVDLTKGSSWDFSQQLQQIELLEELQYLEDRHEHLRGKLHELEHPENQGPDISSTAVPGVRRSRRGFPNKYSNENINELLSHFTFCKLIHPEVENTPC